MVVIITVNLFTRGVSIIVCCFYVGFFQRQKVSMTSMEMLFIITQHSFCHIVYRNCLWSAAKR